MDMTKKSNVSVSTGTRENIIEGAENWHRFSCDNTLIKMDGYSTVICHGIVGKTLRRALVRAEMNEREGDHTKLANAINTFRIIRRALPVATVRLETSVKTVED
jgi:hypothetical protein